MATLAGYRVVVDRTDVLSPAIRAGDVLVTGKVPAGSLAPGDVVTPARAA